MGEKNINETEEFVVLALYKFVSLPDYTTLQEKLLEFCCRQEIKGTILLASEGINGTVAGSREAIDSLIACLEADPRMTGMERKESVAASVPFYRMKVRLKKEIVTMGVEDIHVSSKTGVKLKAAQWNALIRDEDVLLLDTRNHYEIDIGSFKNAISPDTESFREFPDYVESQLAGKENKKIAMFCTGGIRCEKASSYLLEQGFNEVYQLDGGILRYLEEVDEKNNLWEGECFVFDGRVSVKASLEPGSYQQCYACRRPVSPEEMKSDKYREGVSCPACFNTLDEKKRRAVEERQRQVKLAEARNQVHIGASMPGNKKSRATID